MRTERRSRTPALLVGLALLLPGCAGLPGFPGRGELVVELEGDGPAVLYLEPEAAGLPAPRRPRVVEVQSRGRSFQPPLVAVRAGDSVRFVNGGSVTHRLFITDREGRRERLVAPGRDAETLPLSRVGEHRFYCSLHPDESFALFAAPSVHYLVLGTRGPHRLEDVPRGRYHLRRWSEAGDQSLGIVEIHSGRTVSHAVATESLR